MNIASWLDRAAKARGEWPAIASGEHIFSDYAGFRDSAASIAGSLSMTYGLRRGDRVAICARNAPDYLLALYGIWWAGMVAVPVNAKLHGAEVGWILDHSGSSFLFVSDELRDSLDGHIPADSAGMATFGGQTFRGMTAHDSVSLVDRHPTDPAWIFYTSGTTGRPKGAVLSHRCLTVTSYGYLTDVDPTQPGEGLIHAAPMSHGSGLYIMATVAQMGVNIVPASGGFDPEELAVLFAAHPPSSMFAAPTMIKRLVESDVEIDPALIRTIIWGGAPMHVADIKRALARFGPVFAQIYGQGETPMTTSVLSKADIADTVHPRWEDRLASAGLVNSVVEVRIANDDDQCLPTGEVGEILVRGDSLMNGYWKDREASESALRGGWLHTGDIGSFDAEGYLTLKDRSKDLIISGGANIYPREVEEVLLRHEAVREVSVIGRPDAEWGELVIAYVVGKADPDELDLLCLESIARFKRPKAYVFVESLPKNNYGKILKTELRKIDQG